MTPYEQGQNYIKNCCSWYAKILDEPTNIILPDIRNIMKIKVNELKKSLFTELYKIGEKCFCEEDLKQIESSVETFEIEFFYRCSKEYFSAAEYAIKLYEDFDILMPIVRFYLMDDLMYALSKCRHWIIKEKSYINQNNWKERFKEFYIERIKMHCEQNQKKYDISEINMQIESLIQQWENYSTNWIKDIFS